MVCICFSHHRSGSRKQQSKKGKKTYDQFLDYHILCASALKAWADQHLTVFCVVTRIKDFLSGQLKLNQQNLFSKVRNPNPFHLAPVLLPASATEQHRTSVCDILENKPAPFPGCHFHQTASAPSTNPSHHLFNKGNPFSPNFHFSFFTASLVHLPKSYFSCIWSRLVTSPLPAIYLHFSEVITCFLYLLRGKTDKHSMWLTQFLPHAVLVNLSISYETLSRAAAALPAHKAWMSIKSSNYSLCLE